MQRPRTNADHRLIFICLSSNGFEAARQYFSEVSTRMLILILTIDGSSHYALAAVACGAQGLLVKTDANDSLVLAWFRRCFAAKPISQLNDDREAHLAHVAPEPRTAELQVMGRFESANETKDLSF